MFKHATQLLQDFASSYGLNEDVKTLMATIAKELPEVRTSHFSGDVILPDGVNPIQDQLDFGNYLLPTMNIKTGVEGGSITIESIPEGLDLAKTVETVVGRIWVTFPSSDGVTRYDVGEISPNCSFKQQPDFRYNSLEFMENDSIMDREKGTAISVELHHGMDGNDLNLLTVRINELSAHGRGHAFGRKLAELLPKVKVLYYSYDTQKGWEVIHEAWDWNRGKPYIMTEEHYAKIRQLEKATAPYKKLVQPYFDANGYSEGCMLAGNIYGNMESLHEEGIIHPVLLADFSIILGHVGTMAFTAMLMPFGNCKGFDLEKQVNKDVRKIADEVARLGIGSKTSFWKRLAGKQPTLPEPFLVADVLVRMFQAYTKGNKAEVKQLHDEFNTVFPQPIPV